MSWSLRVVERIDSTTAELLRCPIEQAQPGTALLALEQSGGKGRSDRPFLSPPGGMYLSVSLRPREPDGLSLLGSMALVVLLRRLGVASKLRWPNDVTVGGKKIAGVLPVARYSGNQLERAVLGVGFNISTPFEQFPEELRPGVTTLERELPGGSASPEVLALTRDYLEVLEDELQALELSGLPALALRCETVLEALGEERRPCLVEPGQPPVELSPIVGLDGRGALLLEDGHRLEALGRDQRLRFTDELGL